MQQISENEIIKEADRMQLVIFQIRDEEFGVPISEIQEIIKLDKVTPIPDAPKFIQGIINVRGEIVTTIDMKERLFMNSKKKASSRHIVITRQNNNIFGLVVDQVTEVLTINKNEIQARPSIISKMNQEYIQGVTTDNGRLIIILNLSKILSEKEFARLSEAYKNMQDSFDQDKESTSEPIGEHSSEPTGEHSSEQTGEPSSEPTKENVISPQPENYKNDDLETQQEKKLQQDILPDIKYSIHDNEEIEQAEKTEEYLIDKNIFTDKNDDDTKERT